MNHNHGYLDTQNIQRKCSKQCKNIHTVVVYTCYQKEIKLFKTGFMSLNNSNSDFFVWVQNVCHVHILKDILVKQI